MSNHPTADLQAQKHPPINRPEADAGGHTSLDLKAARAELAAGALNLLI